MCIRDSGKTAVVSRLIEDAAQRLVLVGHCVGEAGTTLPYLPFVEMLASLDTRDRDLVDDLVAAYPVSYTHLDVYKRQGCRTATKSAQPSSPSGLSLIHI